MYSALLKISNDPHDLLVNLILHVVLLLQKPNNMPIFKAYKQITFIILDFIEFS